MKRIITLFTISLLFFACKKEQEEIKEAVTEQPKQEAPAPAPVTIEDGELCFLKVVSKDSLMLTLTKKGNRIEGHFVSHPYEKDSKTIKFTGILKDTVVTATGTAMAEGMITDEEFIFTVNNKRASVKMGEMLEGDDGVWRYKNVDKAFSQVLPKTDCKE